VSYYYYIKI